jgi:ribosome-binding factor A
MSTHRLQRVAELLKRELGESIRREIPVNEGGLISVNSVEVSGDLRLATAYVSILGGAEQKKRGIALLEKSRFRIQDHVAKTVILKYTPVLKFLPDDSLERGDRVLQIIEKLEHASDIPAQ